MANQRKPHERDVLLSAVERKFVGYFGTAGQIGTGIPVHERPAEPPVGTIYEQEYVLYQDIELEDGSLLKAQQLQSEEPVPKKFLRGHIAHMPPILQKLADTLAAQLGVKCSFVRMAVVVKQADDSEIGFPIGHDDVPPPAGVSVYAVGESPEERRMAEIAEAAEAYAEGCQEDLDLDGEDDEIAQIREAVKNGDVECVYPRDDGPSAA